MQIGNDFDYIDKASCKYFFFSNNLLLEIKTNTSVGCILGYTDPKNLKKKNFWGKYLKVLYIVKGILNLRSILFQSD